MPKWVSLDLGLKGTKAKVFYLVYIKKAINISYRRIAKMINASETTTYRSISWLCGNNFLIMNKDKATTAISLQVKSDDVIAIKTAVKTAINFAIKTAIKKREDKESDKENKQEKGTQKEINKEINKEIEEKFDKNDKTDKSIYRFAAKCVKRLHESNFLTADDFDDDLLYVAFIQSLFDDTYKPQAIATCVDYLCKHPTKLETANSKLAYFKKALSNNLARYLDSDGGYKSNVVFFDDKEQLPSLDELDDLLKGDNK